MDQFSIANFTGTENVDCTTIQISGGSTVNFLDGSIPGGAPISVSSNSILNFVESVPTVYSGQLSGSGAVNMTGSGTLTISGDNSGFTGPLHVLSGTVYLNGPYGGAVSVAPSATIVYNAPISGDLNVTGGVITTSGANTISVGGNYTQALSATYVVNVKENGQCSLIDIVGTATIAGFVDYIAIDGGVLINYPYKILNANGGVFGTYTILDPPLVIPYLTFSANSVYLLFNANLASAAETQNELNVANQLDHLLPATADESFVLSQLVSLTPGEAAQALNELSGEQYCDFILANLYGNNCLSKTVFNAVRDLTNSCFQTCQGAKYWLQVGGGKGFQGNRQAVTGFHLSRLDGNMGIYSCLSDAWLLGMALGYENDSVYSNIAGRATLNTGNAAIYSFLQSDRFYLLLDLIGSRTWGKFNRPAVFAGVNRFAHGDPRLASGRADLQAGIKFGSCNYNIQPYVAGSGEVYHQSRIKEHNADSLDLSIRPITKWLSSAQIGFHSKISRPNNTLIEFDLAWQHYFGPLQVDETTKFQSFGSPFSIQGAKRGRDGAVGALYVACPATKTWSVYVGAEGELWKNWHAFEFDAGASYRC